MEPFEELPECCKDVCTKCGAAIEFLQDQQGEDVYKCTRDGCDYRCIKRCSPPPQGSGMGFGGGLKLKSKLSYSDSELKKKREKEKGNEPKPKEDEPQPTTK